MSSLSIDHQSPLSNQLGLAMDSTAILDLLKTADFDEFNSILKQIKAINNMLYEQQQQQQYPESSLLDSQPHKKLTISEVIELEIQPERSVVDLGDSYPGNVIEQTLVVRNTGFIPYKLKVTVLCFDDELNDLDEYIFSVRQSSAYDYNETQEFVLDPEDQTSLYLALKSPNLRQPRNIVGALSVKIINGGVIGEIEKQIQTRVLIPKIRCMKELFSSVYQETVIKLAMKLEDMKKYECKIPFKSTLPRDVTVELELIYNKETNNEYEFQMSNSSNEKVTISSSSVTIIGLVGRKIEKQLLEKKKRRGMRGYFCSQLERIISKQAKPCKSKEERNMLIIMKVVDSSLIFCFPTIVEIY